MHRSASIARSASSPPAAFALHNLDYGFAGHLTVRDPEFPDLYWTNLMAVHFSQVKLSNLILADHKGKVVEGTHALNRAGFVLHTAVHETNPDIVAMCHAHTVYGTAFAALGRELEPITQDAAAFFEDHVVIRDEAGAVAVEEKAGLSVADYFKNVKAAIHQNHGLADVRHHRHPGCAVPVLVDSAGVPWWRRGGSRNRADQLGGQPGRLCQPLPGRLDHSTDTGLYCIAVSLVAAAAIVLTMPKKVVNR